ncbi:hypothetical protein I312_102955 [Cryptococcus bacillisporus CA1280]|uniref:Uncharacterized protein n=1 Tax=Cryptococcus bacillisporus CA1280 TaxID=1296109 RepID=A0A0D0VZ04_CRYGA|nr:hypothetical protein I312_00566 [Cryptococcus bacillisporus CA1280]
MFGYYSPVHPKSGAHSPVYASAMHESPRPASSHTPSVAARDFASRPSSNSSMPQQQQETPQTTKNNENKVSEDGFIILPDMSSHTSTNALPPPRQTNLTPHSHLNVPPPSVNDPYVSRFIKRTEPSDPRRPSLHRSSSAPGEHQAHSLLPPALPLGPEGDGAWKDVHQQPVFEVFNGELTEEGNKMSKKLRHLLETVLKGQEQVGKMHFGLEELGEDDGLETEEKGGKKEDEKGKMYKMLEDRLERREKGVDEIMEKLDALSETLRTYHGLGTPKLSFNHTHTPPQSNQTKHRNTISVPHIKTDFPPHDNPPSSASPRSPTSPTSPRSPSHPSIIRAQSSIDRPSTMRAPQPQSPLRQTFRPETTSSGEEEHYSHPYGARPDSAFNNLSPLRLESERSPDSPLSSPPPQNHPKTKSFWEMEDEREREKGHKQQWLENVDQVTDSPFQMEDKSKPF